MQVLLFPASVLANPRLVLRIAVVAVTHTLLVGALTPSGATADPLFGSPLSVGAGSYPYSVAIGDLNGDGKPDLVTANDGDNTVSVLLGHGDGTFSARTDYGAGSEPTSVAIGDLNGDGKPDLAVANFGACCDFIGSVSVLLGNGDGNFGSKRDYAAANGPWFLTIGDLNGDTRPDLVTASSWGNNSVSVLLGNGDGTFGAKTDYGSGDGPRSVAIGDLNGDARPDLVVANKVANTVSVLLGNGDGTFGARTDFGTGSSPASVAIGDLNGDVKADVAVTDSGTFPDYIGAVSVLLGYGDGTLQSKTDYGTGNAPYSVAIRDLNGDHKPDLVTANRYGTFPELPGSVSVLLGSGGGSFGAKTDYATGDGSYSVVAGDLNGDGKPDLATANSTPSTVSVLLNIGPGPLAVEESRVGFALQVPVPNPARELRANFSLADARPARLAIYDASGREVFRREVGNLGAGRHMIVVTPGRLAPGVYLVGLTQGDRRLAARAVVIR